MDAHAAAQGGRSIGSQGAVTVRPGSIEDLAFVSELASDSVTHGIPATRAVAPAAVREYVRAGASRLEAWLRRPDFALLVAERAGEPVGYLMLDLADREPSTGERQAFIIDLGVRRDSWGRYVPHRLVEAAARLAAARGLDYLVGVVSAGNRRALVTSRRLGFEIERHQVVRLVRPQRPPPRRPPRRPTEPGAPGGPPGSRAGSPGDTTDTTG